MGIHQYFKSLNDMENLIRMPGKFKFQQHNVAAHSYKVTKIAQYMGTVEECDGQVINWKSLYEKALNHDYPEIFTGDIKTPVKYASEKLNYLFTEVEESMTIKFIEAEFPEKYQQIYKSFLADEGKDDTIEGQILSVADKIDLLYEAIGEIQKRNPEPLFYEIYVASLREIVSFKHLTSVQDFVDNIIPEMLNEQFIENTELLQLTDEILSKEYL